MIYLDHAAATPIDKLVLEEMQPFFGEIFFNPSAVYSGGLDAKFALEEARSNIARLLGSKPSEIIFTAGATESISIAINSVLSDGGHVIAGGMEHSAVRRQVEKFEHSFAKPEKNGIISSQEIAKYIRDDTRLITVALADSELGTLQSVGEMADLVKKTRFERLRQGNKTPLYFHSDGSQVAGALNLKISRLKIDMLTLNSGKCYGPKQVGLLWINSLVRVQPFFGDSQERGFRAGTENVPGAVGFAKALEITQSRRKSESSRLKSMRNIMQEFLTKNVEGLVVDGHPKRYLPGHLHIHVDGLDAERVVFNLDAKNVYLATGSACLASQNHQSPALKSAGFSASEIRGSLRISLGRLNDEKQVIEASRMIAEAIEKERKI